MTTTESHYNPTKLEIRSRHYIGKSYEQSAFKFTKLISSGIAEAVKEATALNTVLNMNSNQSIEDLSLEGDVGNSMLTVSSPAEDVRIAMRK